MHGEWWIDTRKRTPADGRPPRRTAAGNLIDDGLSGWRLETIGTIGPGYFHDPFDSKRDEFFRQSHTIHGSDPENKMYSLLDCWFAGGNVQMPSVRGGLHNWRVGMIVTGTGVMITPEAEIDQIDIRIKHLDVWAADTRQPDFIHDSEAQSLTLPLETQVVSTQVGDCELQIRWGRATSADAAQITATADAVVRVEGPLRLLEINESWVQPAARLFALLTAKTTYVTRIQARLAKRDRHGRATYVEVRIPQALDERFLEEPTEDTGRQQLDMLTTRRSLEDGSVGLDELVGRYFEARRRDDLCEALDHLIDSQAKTSGFKFDDSLLYGFNSFESYHSALHDTNWHVSDELAATYDDLVSQAPTEHQETVRNRLNKKPLKSFQKMLDDVMADCGQTADSILEAFPQVPKSLEKLRNTIAHTNQGSMTLTQRIDMLGTLHWIMRRALLQAFGIPSDACDQLLGNSHALDYHINTIRSRYGSQEQQ